MCDSRVKLAKGQQNLRFVGLAYSFLEAGVLLATGEGVSQYVPSTRSIYNQKVELSKYFSLAYLTLVQLLSYHKVL